MVTSLFTLLQPVIVKSRDIIFVTWRDPLRKYIWAVDHRMWPTHRVSGPTCDHLWAVDYQCISPQPWVHPVVPEQSKINKYSISFSAEHSVVSVNPVNCQLLAECIKRITTKDSTFSQKNHTYLYFMVILQWRKRRLIRQGKN